MNCALRGVQSSWVSHHMGWLDKLLNKGSEGTSIEKPEESSGLTESEEIASPEPAATKAESTDVTSPEVAPEKEKGPPPREDPFLKGLERHGGDMAWAL